MPHTVCVTPFFIIVQPDKDIHLNSRVLGQYKYFNKNHMPRYKVLLCLIAELFIIRPEIVISFQKISHSLVLWQYGTAFNICNVNENFWSGIMMKMGINSLFDHLNKKRQ